MDNQHRKIKGYRELTQEDILLVNDIKDHGERLRDLVTSLRGNGDLDQRWVNIGATHLQQGVMALVRAVAQPETF